MSILIIILILITTVIVINILQDKKPSLLPSILQNWNFLPIYFRSLDPYDNVFNHLLCCFNLSIRKVKPFEEPSEEIRDKISKYTFKF